MNQIKSLTEVKKIPVNLDGLIEATWLNFTRRYLGREVKGFLGPSITYAHQASLLHRNCCARVHPRESRYKRMAQRPLDAHARGAHGDINKPLAVMPWDSTSTPIPSKGPAAEKQDKKQETPLILPAAAAEVHF